MPLLVAMLPVVPDPIDGKLPPAPQAPASASVQLPPETKTFTQSLLVRVDDAAKGAIIASALLAKMW